MFVKVVEVKPFTFSDFGETGGAKGLMLVLEQRVTPEDTMVLPDTPNLRLAIYDATGASVAAWYAAIGSEVELTITIAPPA